MFDETRVLQKQDVNPLLTSSLQDFIPIFGSGNQGTLDQERVQEIASASCNRLIVHSSVSDRNRIVGTGLLTIYPSPTNNRAEITCLAVLEEYRGKGIGRIILDKCRLEANDALVNSLQLSTGASNTHAKKIFQEFGFVQVSNATSGLVEYEYNIQQGARF